HPALPVLSRRRFALRPSRPGLAGPGSSSTSTALHRTVAPGLLAADKATAEPPGRGDAQRRGRAVAQGAARGPPGDGTPVLRPGQPAHALGAERYGPTPI